MGRAREGERVILVIAWLSGSTHGKHDAFLDSPLFPLR